jgi:hypothetical protein
LTSPDVKRVIKPRKLRSGKHINARRGQTIATPIIDRLRWQKAIADGMVLDVCAGD